MKNQYLNMLKETFKDPSHLDPEQVKQLLDETTIFFGELQAKLKSPDEKEHKEAEDAAVAVRAFLEDQMAKVIDESGLTAEEFLDRIADPKSLSNEDKALVEQAKAQWKAMRGEESKKKKKKKKGNLKLRG